MQLSKFILLLLLLFKFLWPSLAYMDIIWERTIIGWVVWDTRISSPAIFSDNPCFRLEASEWSGQSSLCIQHCSEISQNYPWSVWHNFQFKLEDNVVVWAVYRLVGVSLASQQSHLVYRTFSLLIQWSRPSRNTFFTSYWQGNHPLLHVVFSWLIL